MKIVAGEGKKSEILGGPGEEGTRKWRLGENYNKKCNFNNNDS